MLIDTLWIGIRKEGDLVLVENRCDQSDQWISAEQKN
jgi:hypothetical protein